MKTWQDEEDLELFEKYELRYFYLVYVNGYSEEEANLEIESEAMNHRIVIGLIVPLLFFTVYVWTICFLLMYFPILIRYLY